MEQKPDWHKLARKSLPYLLVGVLTCAVGVAFLGHSDIPSLTELERRIDWKFVGQASMEDTRAELEAEKQALQVKQQELATAMTETQQLLTQLNSVKQETQDLLTEAENQGGAVADKIGELKDAYDHVEELEQQRWVLPMNYTMCTSPFGSRTHPVDGVTKYHVGVDLAAPMGTPIVAARSGTVQEATFEETSGNYVIIDHLDGYKTGYLHMQKSIVKSGQFVVAGQIIGYCGDSGVATGSHLHFEISKDGKKVNPAEYVDIK